MDETVEQLRGLLRDELKVAAEAIDPDTPLLGRGVGLDSVEAMTLITAIEKTFGVRFCDEEISVDLLRSLRHLGNAVRRKRLEE